MWLGMAEVETGELQFEAIPVEKLLRFYVKE
jgi:hypothetical protein